MFTFLFGKSQNSITSNIQISNSSFLGFEYSNFKFEFFEHSDLEFEFFEHSNLEFEFFGIRVVEYLRYSSIRNSPRYTPVTFPAQNLSKMATVSLKKKKL